MFYFESYYRKARDFWWIYSEYDTENDKEYFAISFAAFNAFVWRKQ